MSVPYALYANKAGFSSGSFTIPDGFNNITTVVIPDSSNYIVPAGKNLYLPTAERTLAIDGDTLATNLSGGGANARTFVGASENSSIWIRYEPIAGFLVDKTVTWATINVSTTQLTVPQNKQFVVVNTMYSSFGNPGPQANNCTVTINSVSTNLLSNTVLGQGTIVSSSGCVTGTGQINYIVNGYFMDK